MPTVSSVPYGSTAGQVTGAIARASSATGVDFNYLVAQAKLESGLDPAAQARTSSAAGLYQFINSTWLETVNRHGAEHGLGWAEQAITRSGGRATIADPAMRSQVLALRNDPDAAALMAAELVRDNTAELQGFLGRQPDHAELYLAHFMGAGGAKDFLGSLQRDPSAVAAALFPAQASANRAIFYDDGRARSVGEVMQLMQAKVANALDGVMPEGMPEPYLTPGNSPTWQQFAPPAGFRRAAADYAEVSGSQRASMADTLQSTFGSGDSAIGSRAAARVNDAYGKFRAFGL